MKRALFQLLNLFMVAVVLITSTGFGLVEHSCMMRGKKVSLVINRETEKGCAVHSQKTCSSKDFHQAVVKKAACCAEDERYENVDFSSSITHLLAKFIKSVTDATTAGLVAVFSWVLSGLVPDKSLSVALTSAPLLHFGRSLLSFVQSFLL